MYVINQGEDDDLINEAFLIKGDDWGGRGGNIKKIMTSFMNDHNISKCVLAHIFDA